MSRHVIAFTYLPKIQAVRAGTCTQTIRVPRKRPIESGDNLLLHGWAEKPRHSPWSWRENVTCTYCESILMDHYEGVYSCNPHRHWEPWDSFEANQLALYDGIHRDGDLSPGQVMHHLFTEMYGVLHAKLLWVIRWGGQGLIIKEMKESGTFNPVPGERAYNPAGVIKDGGMGV